MSVAQLCGRGPLSPWVVHSVTMSTPPDQASKPVVSNEVSPVSVWRLRLVTRYEVIGAIVPLAVAAWVAYSRVLSFDGAMNMQVAQSLVQDHVFGRYYGGMEAFPSEIQTSSYFIAISAVAILIFGTSNLTLQAANLVFVTLLAFGLARASVPSRVAAVVFPSVVILGSPGLFEFSLGGYGEGAVAALALIAFLLLARAAVTPIRAFTLVALGFFVLGLAVSIKTVAVAALIPGALAFGFVVVRSHSGRLRVLLAPLAGLIPLAVFEAYRLSVLRGEYFVYWKAQLRGIVYQAGGDSAGSSSATESVFAKMANHLHILGDVTGVAGGWWVAALVAAPIGLIVLLFRRSVWSESQRRSIVLASMLVVYAEVYFAWWLAITPTEKAWLRRLTVGVFALVVGSALIAGILFSRLRDTAAVGRRDRVLASIMVVATVLPTTWVTVRGLEARASWLGADHGNQRALDELAGRVKDLSSDGAQFYGVGWWSAPVVSLYSGVDFDDLATADLCAASTREAIDSGDAYLVWDFYARSLSNAPDPGWPGADFALAMPSNDFGELWRISLPAGSCAN